MKPQQCISISGSNVEMIAICNSGDMCLAVSATEGTITLESSANPLKELLIRAVNNRTRERNYFKKYCELLEGDLTDEQFDNEIDTHPDEYVVSTEASTNLNELELAVNLAKHLKGIESIDDFTALFSFSDDSVRKCISEHPKFIGSL